MRWIFLILFPFFVQATTPNIHSVNVITGEYQESVTDLCQPLVVGRTFTKDGWRFNLPHLLTKEGDKPKELNNTHFEYDKKNRIAKAYTDSNTSLSFDYQTGQCRITSDKGDNVVYYFDEKPFLTKVEINGETAFEYRYEKEKLISRKTLGGEEIHIDYYKKGKNDVDNTEVTIKQNKFAGRVKTLRDSNGKLIAKFFYNDTNTVAYDAFGKKTIYTYSPNELLIHIETFEPNGCLYKKESFKWKDHFGTPLLTQRIVEDSKGEVFFEKTYEYDRYGKLREEDHKLVSYNDDPQEKDDTAFFYNEGRLTRMESPELTLEYHYDEKGKLLSTIEIDEKGNISSLSFFYDDLGCLTQREDRNGNRTDYRYDCFRRLIEEKLPAVFDENAEVIRPTITYSYDILDRLIATTDPKGHTKVFEKPQAPPNPTLYPDREKEKVEVDANGVVTTTTKDALGRPVNVVKQNALGIYLNQKEIRYDANGNKALEIDTALSARGEKYFVKAWEHNPENLVSAFIEGGERVTEFAYEGKKLQTLTKPDGVALTFVYDEKGRLKHRYSSDNTVDDVFHYNEEGRLIAACDSKKRATIRSYDEKGNLASETLGNGLTLHFSYDEKGRRTALYLPDGSQITYEYDEEHLIAVHRGDYTHSYNTFDENHFVIKATLINEGGEIAYIREEENTEIISPYLSEAVFLENGNVTQTIENGEINSFGYDEWNHLIEEPGYHYSYDSLGNRLSKNDSEIDYDRFYQQTDLEYDLNGNLIKNGPYKYFYDALNRLIKVEGEKTITYTYDAFNRRLTRNNDALFIYDGQREIGFTDTSWQIQQLRVLGIGYGADIGAAVAIEQKDELYIPLHDHRGCVRLLIDAATKKPIAEYRYSAFGECEKTPSWGFMSKRHDPDTGLIHFGERDLDPKTGRWLTRDPLLGCDGENPYAFVQNRPLSQIDHLGLFSFPLFCKNVGSFFGSIYANLVQFKDQYAYENAFQYEVDSSLDFLFGNTFHYLTGYHIDPPDVGVYGNGELDEKVRVTFINGVLNDRILFTQTVTDFSNAHGGCNIHYVYRNTEGWTLDGLKGLMTKFGVVSPYSKNLANQWRHLIQDMGGPEGGGLIIHYAHSMGGGDTAIALHLLKPEERKMIRVITIGSPVSIPIDGLEGCVNYGSCHDGVSLLNLINIFHPVLPSQYHVVFIGSIFGIPLMDHFLANDTYTTLVRQLGKEFVETYGKGSL